MERNVAKLCALIVADVPFTGQCRMFPAKAFQPGAYFPIGLMKHGIAVHDFAQAGHVVFPGQFQGVGQLDPATGGFVGRTGD